LSQRLVIRLIPIHIVLVCLLAGWAAMGSIRALIGNSNLPAAAQTAVAGAAGALHSSGAANALNTSGAGGRLSPIFTPEVQHWADKLASWSAVFNLDPNLAATVMQIESCGAPKVVSSSGAQGLFQVMPDHFAAGEDMLDPDINAARGVAYLALGLVRASGNAGLALAGYNGGHGQIGRDSSLWPAETQRYFYWGTGIYQDAASGQPQSGRLQEWLNSGGASLCAQADQQIGMN
jgi:soluble lytic murein transglycosylase-like protein